MCAPATQIDQDAQLHFRYIPDMKWSPGRIMEESRMTGKPVELILSIASFGITLYFWFVQARRERAQLRFYQIGSFRGSIRRHQQRDDVKRLCVQQLDSCGVLIANNSIRQNSIVLFHCWFVLPDGTEIEGDWGSVGNDRPPWNIGPESSISDGDWLVSSMCRSILNCLMTTKSMSSSCQLPAQSIPSPF